MVGGEVVQSKTVDSWLSLVFPPSKISSILLFRYFLTPLAVVGLGLFEMFAEVVASGRPSA